jgi:hypothetical protein
MDKRTEMIADRRKKYSGARIMEFLTQQMPNKTPRTLDK